MFILFRSVEANNLSAAEKKVFQKKNGIWFFYPSQKLTLIMDFKIKLPIWKERGDQ